MPCGHCADGWRCQDHTDQPAGARRLPSRPTPCRHPDCPPFTAVACRECHRPVAIIDEQTPTRVAFVCPACGCRWKWDNDRTRWRGRQLSKVAASSSETFFFRFFGDFTSRNGVSVPHEGAVLFGRGPGVSAGVALEVVNEGADMVQESRREIGARWALRDRHGEAISMRCPTRTRKKRCMPPCIPRGHLTQPRRGPARSRSTHSVHQRGKTWLVSHRLILKETDCEFRE